MNAKFTPGPWSLTPRFQDKVDVVHHNDGPGKATRTICRVNVRASWLVEQKANAQLLAAAPELLEALRGAVGWIETSKEGEEATRRALAAIAKATGEQA